MIGLEIKIPWLKPKNSPSWEPLLWLMVPLLLAVRSGVQCPGPTVGDSSDDHHKMNKNARVVQQTNCGVG